ncbi:MAG: UDP-N-acetylmuramoyl-L-alanine--D-glutamate ligase [Anaerolineaceae bacterium]|nr:UDP-N-acetylmuramoyl-L-alanine--D-glutamate ligase [Anaerolineaceae bacterium]
MKTNWQDKNVLIIGAARQGLSLARFLCVQGATVTLNDGRPESELQTSIDQLNGLPIHWVMGQHPFNLLENIDLVCVSGGVPLDIPLIIEASKRNILLSNDSQIFMETVAAPVIAITGSAGKTTTTSLMGDIAKRAAQSDQKVWVGGNIGNPLISQVEEIFKNDIVILELSSFQLELMTKSPHIAAITNITPNHLDRHKTLDAYTAAKSHILLHQTSADYAIINRDDSGASSLKPLIKGHYVSFGLSPLPENENGVFVQDQSILVSIHDQIQEICTFQDIPLKGIHNIYNVLAACAISGVAGFDAQLIKKAIKEFKGVPHRLELVRTWKGVQWIDDSIATAPERTMAAIESFSEPIILLLGGKDKNLPWEKLLQLVNEKVDHVVLFGDAALKIKDYIAGMAFQNQRFSLHCCTHLQEAVQSANKISQPGDIVLLSPGGTSYDEFKDFEERGEKFQLWVQQLE